MADDVAVTPGIGASVATDEVGGRHFQRVKVTHGADGTATDVSAASPLPVSAPAALPVDSELPAAAALTDAMANPTAPAVASHGMLWNGATWDREASKEEGTLLASAARTATVTSPTITSPNARGVALLLRISAVTGTPSLTLQIKGYVGPDSNWYDVVMLYNGTETPASAGAAGSYGFMVYPGLVLSDPAALSGGYVSYRIGTALPRRWFVDVVHGTADSITYSLAYCTLP